MNDQIHTISTWLGSGSINIFGLPFAGKDTQGETLAKLFSAELVAGGDILRSHNNQEELQHIMATGALIPTDMYFSILLPYLSQEAFTGKPLILSSVGRMNGEQETIVKATADSGHPIKAVVMLSMPEEVVWERYEIAQQTADRGTRADDGNRDVLANRLNKFRAQTIPVIEFYREKGLLIEVDGTLSREEVTQEILGALSERAAAA